MKENLRKKPYKASELFEEICKRITLPEHLDYHIGSHSDIEIKGYEFDFGNHLEYGGNEGIYLSMYADFGDGKRYHLGTFKTLREDRQALEEMAKLLADFIFEGKWFVNQNLDDFTWEGYNVKGKGQVFSMDVSTLERAMEVKEQLLAKYDEVTIFDYAKRKYVG